MTENRKGFLRAGPFSNLFEASFLDHLASSISQDPLRPAVVLVGSNLLGIHLRHALVQKTGGHANIRFVTFVDLTEHLTRDVFLEAGRRDFPADVEDLLIGELCKNLRPDSLFYDVREQDGFHQALRSTFHDCVDAGITTLPKSSAKLREVSRLFDEHRRNYLNRFATTADRISEASRFGDRYPSIFGTSSLLVYGFYDLTKVQRQLLAALSRFASLDVWIPLPGHCGEPGTNTLRFFEEMLGPSEEILPGMTPSFAAFSAPDLFSEAEEIVRSVLTISQEDPVPLHRIGILLRNPEEQLPAFIQVLDRARLPYYREGGAPLAQTPLGETLRRLLDLLGGEWPRTDLIRLLTIFPFSPSSVAVDKVGAPADWDRWTKEAFVVAGRDQFLSRLSGLERRLDLQGDASAKKLKGFISFMWAWFDDIRALEAGTNNWSTVGLDFSRFLLRYAGEDPAFETITSMLRGLSDLKDTGIAPTSPLVRKIIKSRLARASLRGATFERDGLFLGSIVSARGVLFDHVVIPGLAERSFPAPPRPDPILLDHERRKLNQTLDAQLPLKEARLAEELFLFELATSQGERNVILSYPRASSADERERFPSSFLLRVSTRTSLSLMHRPRLRWNQTSGPWIDERDWMETDVAARIVRDPRHAWSLLTPWTPLAAAVRRWVEERLGSFQWGPYDGVVAPAELSGDSQNLFSASDLSAYATCPYRFFLRKKIKLESIVRPDEIKQLRPVDRGEIIHEILFRLFTELRKLGLLPLSPDRRTEIDRNLSAIAEEVFNEVAGRLPLGPQLLWATERMFILSDLRALLDMEIREGSNFQPEAFEVRFGMPATLREDDRLSTDEPVYVSTGSERLGLRGRIDRIDLSPDRRRARIVDYKTGALKDQKEDALDGGKAIQLPVYLSALSVLLPQVDLHQSEAVLLSTAYGSGFRRIRFGGATLEARKNEFAKILATISKGIRSGLFPPFPGKGLENCTFCDYRPICGRSVLRLYERKESDPAISSLLELGDIP